MINDRSSSLNSFWEDQECCNLLGIKNFACIPFSAVLDDSGIRVAKLEWNVMIRRCFEKMIYMGGRLNRRHCSISSLTLSFHSTRKPSIPSRKRSCAWPNDEQLVRSKTWIGVWASRRWMRNQITTSLWTSCLVLKIIVWSEGSMMLPSPWLSSRKPSVSECLCIASTLDNAFMSPRRS